MILLGADTHKRTHTVAAIKATTGEHLGDEAVVVGEDGFFAALAWARGIGEDRVWAIEDCWHVSGSLERFLIGGSPATGDRRTRPRRNSDVASREAHHRRPSRVSTPRRVPLGVFPNPSGPSATGGSSAALPAVARIPPARRSPDRRPVRRPAHRRPARRRMLRRGDSAPPRRCSRGPLGRPSKRLARGPSGCRRRPACRRTRGRRQAGRPQCSTATSTQAVAIRQPL